jgi:hypothetical protein
MKIRHHQKTKVQAKKEREMKAKLEDTQPGLYQHPSPFNTNPFWQQEIDMGPSLPKKSASKNSSQRGLTSAGKDSEAPSVSEVTRVGDSRTNFGDSTTVIPQDDALSEDWNCRHGYQREDEELWGQWSGQKLMDAFSKAKVSAGRLMDHRKGGEKEVTEQARHDFYFTPKNPPVNDYHPPVVSSKAPHRTAHQWMLQPPPPAKVMEGKVPVSRAFSSASKASGRLGPGEDIQLGRMVNERLTKDRLEKENDPTERELIESLFVTRSHISLSAPRSRSLSMDGMGEAFDLQFERSRSYKGRSRARPPGEESDSDSDDDLSCSRPEPSLQKAQTLSVTPSMGPRGHASQRPRLETIVSAGTENTTTLSSTRLSKKRRSAKMRALSGTASPVGDDTD